MATLVIREAQMAVLQRAALASFEDRLLGHLRGLLDPTEWPTQRLRQNVRSGIARAADCGFDSEADIEAYIEIVCRHLDGFRRAPHPPQAMLLLFDRANVAADRLRHFRQWAESNEFRL